MKKNQIGTGVRNAAARRQKRTKKLSRGAVISLCVVAAIIVGVLACAFAVMFTTDKSVVNSGILLNGYDISGMTSDELTSYLSSLENPYKDFSVNVEVEGTNVKEQIDAKVIELTIDVPKTVNRSISYAKKNPFVSLWAKLFKKDIDYIYSYNHMELDSRIIDIAHKAGGTLVQHEVNVLEKEIVIHAGKEGLGVDVANLRNKVIDAIKPGAKESIAVNKVNTVPASIDIQELFEMTKREVQDAKYAVEDNDVIVEEEIDGRYFDVENAKTLLKDFNPGSPDVSIPFIIQEATVKADALSMALFGDVLGSYSTKYMTSNVARSNNVELAAKYINGKILLPGEEFSYNGVVGKRSVERGFRAASVYENNKMVDGLGGGICQTSSTLYAAVLYADLEVVERHEHSLEVSYAPLGMDATVAYGSLDFRFKNNTNAPIKIVSSWGGGTVSTKILGTNENKNKTVKINTQTISTKPYGVTEIKDSTLPTGQTVVDAPGFKGHVVNTYKVIYENGKEVENKFLHKSTYTMVNKVVRVGTGEAAATVNPTDPELLPLPEGETPQPTASPDITPTPSSSPIVPTQIPMPDGL